MPTSVTPCALDHRHAPREQPARRGEHRPRLGGRLAAACASASPARSRRSAAAARPCGRPGRPRACRRVTRSTSADERRRRSPRPSTAAAPSARCEPIEPPAPAACTGRGSRLCASACRCRPRARPSIATSAARRAARPVATVVIPRSCSLRRGHRPDAPEPLDRQRVEEGELAVGRDDEQPVGLRHGARDLGEELRPRDADGDRQADLARHAAAAGARRSRSACRRSAPCRARRGTPRRSTAPRRRAWCPRRPGRPPCSPRRRPTSAAARRPPAGRGGARCRAAHRGADAERLRLVARGEHDARRRR